MNKWKHEDGTKWCRVADAPVVAINPWPRKAGDRPEGKTEGTLHLVAVGHTEPKAGMQREGAKIDQSVRLREQIDLGKRR